MITCPTDQELESLLDERVAPPDAPTRASSLLTHHVETCDRCRERIDLLQRDRSFMNEIVGALSDVSDHSSADGATQPTTATLSVSGYDIEGELHRGAQGVVFKAHQHSTNRKIALKVLYHESGTSLRMRQRFLREVELAAQLRHPNVVTIHDSGETDDGRLYFAMEFVDGPRLDAYARSAALDTTKKPAALRSELLDLFDAICAGVAHAHELGVIHRDLKPGNILIAEGGAPKVLDFGLAKATSADVNERFALSTIAGSFMGTIAYASPEQTRGNPADVDTRSDVYALGVLLYELVTGKLPYDVKGSLKDGIENVLHAEPAMPMRWRSPDDSGKPVNRDLETIILKALSKTTDRRYQSVEALRDDLARYRRGEAISARRDSRAYRATLFARRHPGVIGAGLLVVVFSAAIAILSSTLFTTQQAAQTAAETIDLYAARLAEQEMWDATSGVAREVAPPPAVAAEIDGNTVFKVNAPEPPRSLNPTYTYRGDLFVCDLIFERLFWRDANLNLIPNQHLVESIDASGEPTVKTIRLRSGLTWHDGKPLTAEDVAYSWRQTIAPAVHSSKQRQASRIASVEAEDPRTIRIELDAPHATWRVSANFELIPRHLFERGDVEDPTLRTSAYFQALHRAPIGSGPYRFESWEDDSIRLRRFDGYEVEGERPHAAEIVVRWLESPEAKLDAFLAGELDLFEMTGEQYRTQVYTDAFEEAGREARRPSSRYHFVAWNCDGSVSALKNVAVRRALAMAIHIDRIKANVTNNLAAACFGPWGPDSRYADPSLRRFAYRPAVAREMLAKFFSAETKHPNPAKKLSERPGSEPWFEIDLLVHGGSEQDVLTAEIVRDGLEDIGVAVKVTVIQDRAELVSRLESGAFDACVMAVTPGVDPELHHVEFETDGRLNFGGYSDENVDSLFAEAQLAEESEREAIYREVHRRIYDAQPRTFLYHEPALWAVSHRLSGVSFSSRGPYYFQPGVLNWWAPAESKN